MAASSAGESNAARNLAPQHDVLSASDAPIRLEPRGTSWKLPLGDEGGRRLDSFLEQAEPEQRLVLVLRGLRADEPPGVLFHLYLALATGEEPGAEDPRHVGSFNFFGAVPGPDRFLSFDLGEVARRLHARGTPLAPLIVTAIPSGDFPEGARPTIGRAELVLQGSPR